MSVAKVERIGGFIGGVVARAILVLSGYFWAKHGVTYMLEFFGITLGVGFALYGIGNYPWRSDTKVDAG